MLRNTPAAGQTIINNPANPNGNGGQIAGRTTERANDRTPGAFVQGADADPQSVALNGDPLPSVAGDSPASTGVRGLSSFTVVYDNAGQPDTKYFLGSRNALARSGITAADPTKVPTELESFLASFDVAPIAIGMIVARASSDPAQLQETMKVYTGFDINGSNKGEGSVDVGALGNPTFENDLLLRIKFNNKKDQPILSWNQFMTFDVLADEKLTITITASAAWNRQR